MSTAANASELENPTDYLVAGVVSVINADTPRSPFQAFGPRIPAKMPKNRVEVMAANFSRVSDQMNQAPNGQWYYNDKQGTLRMAVVSQRQDKESIGPDGPHAKAVGRCRYLVSRYAGLLLPSVVGGFQIIDLIDNGERYTASENFDVDRTELNFTVRMLIPPANYADY